MPSFIHILKNVVDCDDCFYRGRSEMKPKPFDCLLSAADKISGRFKSKSQTNPNRVYKSGYHKCCNLIGWKLKSIGSQKYNNFSRCSSNHTSIRSPRSSLSRPCRLSRGRGNQYGQREYFAPLTSSFHAMTLKMLLYFHSTRYESVRIFVHGGSSAAECCTPRG